MTLHEMMNVLKGEGLDEDQVLMGIDMFLIRHPNPEMESEFTAYCNDLYEAM